MNNEHSAWYQGLDPVKRQAIRELHRLNRAWNLVAPVFFAIWALAAWLMLHFNSWLVLLPGYVLIGLLIHGLSNLMHEGIHGSLFRNRRWDRHCAFLVGLPSTLSASAYRVNHLLHHKYTRTEQDPDEFDNVSKNVVVRSIFFYAFIVFGMILFVLRLPFIAWKNASPRQRREMAKERLLLSFIQVAVVGAALYFGCFTALLQVWLFPLCFTILLGNVRGWTEHALTHGGHPLTKARTVTSNRVFSFLNLNLNYHLEHHLFPGVPWYNLPKVHQILLDDYRAAGASVYRSYFVYLVDAFRLGAHGITPAKAPANTAAPLPALAEQAS